MSKKLNDNDQMESIDAAKQLYFCWNKSTQLHNAHITISNKKESNFFDDTVRASVVPETNWYNVNIMWDELPLNCIINKHNYHSYGLYGVYSSSYYHMKFDEIQDCLTITSDESDNIIQIYAN